MTEPRVATISHADIQGGRRLDAAYFQDDFVLARLRVTASGLPTVPLAGDGGLVKAWIPGRTSLVLTQSVEHGTPYLRAHDALDRLPMFERYVALNAMAGGEALTLARGWIVLTCSGRNFGPCAYVTSRLAGAVMTDIMRLVPRSEADGLYALSFLATGTGQSLIRRDPAGSVINHLAPGDLERIPVPVLPDIIRSEVVTRMRNVVRLLDAAGEEIERVDARLRRELGLPEPSTSTWASDPSGPRVGTRKSHDLGFRCDAEFFSERHLAARAAIARRTHERLDAASHLVILGRYKRYYVEAPHGTPILSSGQMHQFRPVALKRISDRSFREPDAYRLRAGWSLIACDGRSEGELGRPAYVSSVWDGWMASNHVMRVVPKPGIHPGYLHAALRLQEVQVQFKSVATGSVIDALDDVSCGPVIIPRLGEGVESELGAATAAAWEQWAEASRLEAEATDIFEMEIRRAYEGGIGQAA